MDYIIKETLRAGHPVHPGTNRAIRLFSTWEVSMTVGRLFHIAPDDLPPEPIRQRLREHPDVWEFKPDIWAISSYV